MFTSAIVVAAGWVFIGAAVIFARRLPRIDAELRQHLIGDLPPDRDLRWPSRPQTLYRMAGWPLLDALRHNTLLAYLCGVAGVVCLMYGCPALLG